MSKTTILTQPQIQKIFLDLNIDEDVCNQIASLLNSNYINTKEKLYIAFFDDMELRKKYNIESTTKKTIFTDLLPLVGEHYTLSASYVGNNQVATLTESQDFEFVDGLNLESESSLIWRMSNDGKLSELTNHSEAQIIFYIKLVFFEVFQALGLCGVLDLDHDYSLTYKNPTSTCMIGLQHQHGHPIGVVEVVKQGNDNILNSAHLDGKMLDSMLRLYNVYGQKNVFGIATTYQEWRIYWLPECGQYAKSKVVDAIFKESIVHDHFIPLYNTDLSIRSSVLPQTHQPRLICATPIISYTNRLLPQYLCSVVSKMYHRSFSNTPLYSPEKLFIQLTEKSWCWTLAPETILDLVYDIGAFGKIDSILLLQDFRGATHGRVWLACSSRGNVFVVKFPTDDSFMQMELTIWEKVWGLPTLKGKWNGAKGFLMPFVLPASQTDWEDPTFIPLVAQAVRSLVDALYHHNDLHRRHVGLYKKGGQKVVVFFDLSSMLTISPKEKEFYYLDMLNNLDLS
ncbi:hypothetical protein CYY_000449 [Polysphondylium violaceum]|uniref:DUF5898 domain-containing protein n=1 Tax=Polysphondylium violaceum TaxID=133409 RepID=A0A8J4Q3M9_9MYCE|nr:hypothetical protein CYY_000449 [Polysphondylium violaceum]